MLLDDRLLYEEKQNKCALFVFVRVFVVCWRASARVFTMHILQWLDTSKWLRQIFDGKLNRNRVYALLLLS